MPGVKSLIQSWEVENGCSFGSTKIIDETAFCFLSWAKGELSAMVRHHLFTAESQKDKKIFQQRHPTTSMH